VRFDSLRFGPESSATTDAFGAYALTSLPAGTYHLQATSPTGSAALTPRQTVASGEGEATGDVDFTGTAGIVSWRNPVDPADVTGDGHTAPLDALVLINYLNAYPGQSSLPSAPVVPPPYYDVDGNGQVTAADVLMVINILNAASQQGSGASAGEGAPAVPPAGSGAEGESLAGTSSAASTRSTLAEQRVAPANAPTHAANDTSVWTRRPPPARLILAPRSPIDDLAGPSQRLAGFEDVLNEITPDLLTVR
jgi:hypothetical protein